ncbi:DUF7713 domain-containing protein [Planococcus sp. X10-3]|uniref:DUF7713 domain-containing protein n=1 Tax=Planococcus sp. X10-3 TaxID=3061240 RepID=UPI003BB0F6AC
MDGDVPLLAVDGKSYRWDEFGRMLMSYEVNRAPVSKTIQYIHDNCMKKRLSPEIPTVFGDSFSIFIQKWK